MAAEGHISGSTKQTDNLERNFEYVTLNVMSYSSKKMRKISRFESSISITLKCSVILGTHLAPSGPLVGPGNVGLWKP